MKAFSLSLIKTTAAFLSLSFSLVWANEPLSFAERWAVSSDKQSLLSELSPKTDEYYYYHSLTLLHNDEADQLLELLERWDKQPASNPTLRKYSSDVRNRALAIIAQQPQHPKRLSALESLGIQIDDPAPVHPADESIPSSADPQAISEENITKGWTLDKTIRSTPPHLLPKLLTEDLPPKYLNQILSKLTTPSHPELVSFILKDLRFSKKPFGQHKIHSLLTTAQLKELVQHSPVLRSNATWVSEMLQRIQPTSETEQRLSYTERCETAMKLVEFTNTLPPSFHALKLNSLTQKLYLDLASGKPSLADYLALLRLTPKGLRAPRLNDQSSKLHWANCSQPKCPTPVHQLKNQLAEFFLKTPANVVKLSPFFQQAELQRLQARAHLLNGDLDDKWTQILSTQEAKELAEASELQIQESTPTHWKTKDTPYLDLILKNTPVVVVSTYKLDLKNYISRHKKLPDLTLDTASLTPHHQETFEFSNNALERFSHKLTFPELTSHGDWLVKVESSGLSSAALIHKGDIHTLASVTSKGHLLQFLDESHNPISNLEATLGNQTLSASNGKLLVPFTPYPTEQTIILSRLKGSSNKGRTSFYSLANGPAQYQLKLGALQHHELYSTDKEVTLYIQPQLTVNQHEAPISKLANPVLELSANLFNGDTLSLHRSTPSLEQNKLHPITFTVPAELARLTITLSAKIENQRATAPTLTATSSITPPSIRGGNKVGNIYTQFQEEQRVLFALGKNGEPLPQLPLKIRLKHRTYQDTFLHLDLKTDDTGMVRLGNLSDYQSIHIPSTNLTTEFNQTLHNNQTRLPKQAYFVQGHAAKLSCNKHTKHSPTFQLFRSNSEHSFLNEISSQLKVNINGNLCELELPKLKEGLYTIISNQGDFCEVNIMQRALEESEWMIDDYSARIITLQKEPSIASAHFDETHLNIQLTEFTKHSRIHVVGSHFLDHESVKHLLSHEALNSSGITLPPSLSDWNNGGILSSEQQYIQRRRVDGHRLGTMLHHPSLLMQPWEIDKSQATQYTNTTGGTLSAKRKQHPGSELPKIVSYGATGHLSANPYHASFLKTPAKIFANLIPDTSGKLSIPKKQLDNHNNLEIVLTDKNHTTSFKLAKPEKEIQTRDQRFRSELDLTKHYVPRQEVQVLRKAQPITLNSSLKSDWTAFTSRADVIHYLSNYSRQPEKMHLARHFYQWELLNEEQKLKVLSEDGCHELHLFLKLHHTQWFDANVRTLIENKRHQSFLDLFLIDADLSRYLIPWQYQRLNAAEQALLAHTIPSAKESIVRALTSEREASEQPMNSSQVHFNSLINFSSEQHSDTSFEALKISLLLKNTILTDIMINDEESLHQALLSTSELIGYPIGLPQGFEPQAPMGLKIPSINVQGFLDYVAEMFVLRLRISDKSIDFIYLTGSDDEALATRKFRVPPNFRSLIGGNNGRSIQELLEEAGVSFPRASYAKMSHPTSLLVRNTATNLDIMEQLLEQCSEALPKSSADPFAIAEGMESSLSPRSPAHDLISSFSLEELENAHENSDTKRWSESYYYRREWTDKLQINSNQFWIDLAKAKSLDSFLSENFSLCGEDANESLLACAILKLPSQRQPITTSKVGNQLKLQTTSPCIVAFEDIIESDEDADNSIEGNWQFFNHVDPFDIAPISKAEVTEFQKFKIYTMSVQCSNQDSEFKTLHLFWSLPNGAIALSANDQRTHILHLKPYSRQQVDVSFYFPKSGDYEIYPPQVSENGQLVATFAPRTLQVAETIKASENTSWEELASYGTNNQVLERLASGLTPGSNIDLIAWRMKDKTFYQKATKILNDQLSHSPILLAYSFLHNDRPSQGEWLAQHFAKSQSNTPPYRESVSRFDSHQRQPIEWSPLIIERAHQLTDQPRLNQPSARQYYEQLLNDLSWKAKPSHLDLLDIIYFLFLQDRATEASKLLTLIEDKPTRSEIQLNYLLCYNAFLQNQPAKAKSIASKALLRPMTTKWKSFFTTVIEHSNQIETQEVPFTNKEVSESMMDQGVKLTSLGHDIHLKHGDINSTKLNIYEVDLETLFSSDPFYSEELGGYQGIQPSTTLQVALDSKAQKTVFPLPEQLRSKNLLVTHPTGVEIEEKVVIDSSTIDARIYRKQGALQVIQPLTDKALPETYIKIYVKLESGEVEFYKDGYTDLRGMYPYNTHNRIKLNSINEFAILLLHPKQGAKRILIK